MAGFLLMGRWSIARLGIDFNLFNVTPDFRLVVLAPLMALAGHFAISEKHKLDNSFLALTFAFFAWMSATSLWSENSVAASAKTIDCLAVIGFLFCFKTFTAKFGTKQFLKAFLVSYFSLIALLSIAAIFELSGSITSLDTHVNRKVFAVGSGPNVFGRNTAMLTIALLLIKPKSTTYKVWLTILAGIPFGLTLATGSRGALLELIIPLLVTLVATRHSFKFKLLMPVLLFAPLSSTAIAGYEGSALAGVISTTSNRLVTHTIYNFHDSSRTELWKSAYEQGVNSPVIGAGLGSYEYVVEDERGIVLSYPHNILAEAWAEGGAIGLLLLIKTV